MSKYLNVSDKVIDYWQETTLSFKKVNSSWLGYESKFNQFDINTPLSVSHGICGIAIADMNLRMKKHPEYLQFFNYSFDF
jgi:hypothetical protein